MKNIEQHFLLNIFCIFYWFVSKHLSSASCIIHCIWICLKCLTFNSLTVFWMSGIVHTWLNYWEIIGVNSVEGGGGLLKKKTSVQPYIFSQLTAAELACWRQIHSMHGIWFIKERNNKKILVYKLPKTLKAQKSNWNRRHFCMHVQSPALTSYSMPIK